MGTSKECIIACRRHVALFLFLAALVTQSDAWITVTVKHDGRRVFACKATASGKETTLNAATEAGYVSDTVQDHQTLRFGGVGRLYSNLPETAKDEASASSDTGTLQVLERLKAATVVVAGLGGVGSWAAEALCRSGVGNIVLIDLDDICISNTNRQLHALSSTVGKMKIDEMKRRLLDINPDCSITLIHDFISADNAHSVLSSVPAVTAVLDAIDGSTEKSALLAACTDLSIPVVTCGGAAGRMDPTQIVCTDITRVRGDKLLRTCRRNLRKYRGFERGVPFHVQQKNKKKYSRKWKIDCVYSNEDQRRLPSGTDESSLRRCDGALGTACFVTGTYGFVAAARVVDMIARDRLVPPRR